MDTKLEGGVPVPVKPAQPPKMYSWPSAQVIEWKALAGGGVPVVVEVSSIQMRFLRSETSSTNRSPTIPDVLHVFQHQHWTECYECV